MKGFCDVDAVVSEGEAMDWRHCAAVIRKHGCHNVVYAAMTACRAVLDCDPPQELMAGVKVGRLRRSVIRRLQRARFRAGVPLPSDSRWLAAKIGSSLALPYSTYTLPMLCRKVKKVAARNIPRFRRRPAWQ